MQHALGNDLALETLDLHYGGSDASVRGPNPSSIEGEWLEMCTFSHRCKSYSQIVHARARTLTLFVCIRVFDSRKPLCLTEVVTPSQRP